MDEHQSIEDERLTRRGSLARMGGLLVTVLAAGACGAESSGEASSTSGPGSGPSAVASGAVRCVLTPEQTEGPYYIAGEAVRRNITEGRPGTPLHLRTTVVDASTCKPIRGAAVDVWHCDAGGAYSGVGTDEGTFMRGIQRTNAAGLAAFETVYPGWYRGRTVHVHVKVHLGGNVIHTGQLYFPDALTDSVYESTPYNQRPGRDVRNATDAVYRNGGKQSLLRLHRNDTGAYVATITMGVSRS